MVDIVNIGLKVDSRDVDRGTKSLDQLGKQSEKTETATKRMLRTFAGYATIGFAAKKIYDAIDAHRQFTKAISELSAITGATGKDLEFYSNSALIAGSNTVYSATQIAGAYKLVASAKPDLLANKEALASVTQETLTLATAAGIDLVSASNAVGGSLNQFGAAADQASRFVNVLAAGSKYGASEISDTAEAMKVSGAVAHSLGLSFEETNAAIQALAAVSIKGSEAGTGLRGVLLKLSTQSKDEFNPQIVGLEKALQNLAAAHLTTADKAKLFGQESITAATALIQQANSIGGLTKQLTGTQTAMEQARIQTDNLDGDIKRMNGSWSTASDLLGRVVDPILRGIVQLLEKMGKTASSMAIGFEDAGQAVGAYAAAAAAALSGDLDRAKQILDARDKEHAANQQLINDIWSGKAAADEKAKSDEEAAAKSAQIAKEAAERKAAQEAAQKETEQANYLQSLQDKYDTLDTFLQTETERTKAAYDQRAAILLDALNNELITKAKYQELSAKLETKRSADMKKATDNDKKTQIEGALNTAANVFGVQKQLAIATVLTKAPQAIASAVANAGGLPFGLWAGIATGAEYAAQLASASGVSLGGGGGGIKNPGGGGGGGSTPTAPTAPSISPAGGGVSGAPTQTVHVTIDGVLPTDPDQLDQLAKSIAKNVQNGGKSPVAA